MMKDLGLQYFRMSLSWSRLLPNGTTDNVNQKAIDFYNKVFDELDAAGITPFVTLYHWDLPSAFEGDLNEKGWLSKEVIR